MELTELGLTQEQITEAVVNKISSEMLYKPSIGIDEEGNEYVDYENTPYYQELKKQVKQKIDTTIETIIDKHVLPNAEQQIKNIVIERTNTYGERKGEPQTIVEYLTARAESFMLEEVDCNGKPKGRDSYNWRKHGTRITYMIDSYLQYHIENWAKNALTEANKTIVEGLKKTIEMKLNEVLKSLKVNLK